MAYSAELLDHLASGATTLARAWALDRRDGVAFGFTDHDRDLGFEGRVFRADTGVTASALQQTTGLSVDNSEAMGALSDEGLTEADILAGRYDGAVVRCWVVNWQDVGERALIFRGSIGEMRRGGGAFHAELRGLSEALNVAQGRVYQQPCSAILGDGACRVDLTAPEFFAQTAVAGVEDERVFSLPGMTGFAQGWFERGRFRVMSGAAKGLTGFVKVDQMDAAMRRVDLWQAIGAPVAVGDLVRVEAGCDKRLETCRGKFANLLNFRGFPSIPGEDWLVASPQRQVKG